MAFFDAVTYAAWSRFNSTPSSEVMATCPPFHGLDARGRQRELGECPLRDIR